MQFLARMGFGVQRKPAEERPIVGYLFILPAYVFFLIFVLYPVVQTFILSFYEWPGIGDREFVGFANYVEAVGDAVTRLAVLNNVIYTIGIVVFAVFPGLILATLLSYRVRGRTVFQTIFFFPRLISQVIVALVWGWLYNPIFGLLNRFLEGIGLEEFAIGWLGHPDAALYAVIIAAAWTYFGFCMVIFLAALQNTDPNLYDAATIDGANAIQTFFNVTLPQIRSVITMVIIYTVMDSFKVFDLIYVMTGGGPGNRTQIMATHLYREAFSHNHFGYGATIAVLLTLLVLAFAIVYQRIREREQGE